MSHNEHTLRQFDVQLEAVRERVLRMGGLVENQISLAIESLITRDEVLMQRVILDDRRVNALEVEIDETCNNIIACRQPAANDLRMLMTVIKTITDLERIGDEAKKIARMGQRLVEAGYIHGVPRYMEIRHAARLVQDMLHVSLDTFARMDISAVAEVVKQDKQVDEEYRAIVRQLISFMMEDPRTISPALDMMFVAKAIERIGDHAKNMSEYVVYLVKGRDVRHVTLEEIEREVHPAQTNTSIGQPGA